MHKKTGVNNNKFGIIPPEQIRKIAGKDLFDGWLKGIYPLPPICNTLDFRLSEVDHGRAVFTGTPDARFYNPIGSVHGGYISTLLDSAMACAVHSTLSAGKSLTTLDLKVSFIQALNNDSGNILAEGNVISSGHRIAIAEGRLFGEDDVLYAHGTATCLIFTI
jgi:uncharacterized protein (TIGR00369 family)